ncbi:uncharacterized protein [Henckelia pumila]|uniref:uncharacterized protein n=1 Tax=Henckelia pumila TaxID=405737 RepID=UPI003C6E05D6
MRVDGGRRELISLLERWRGYVGTSSRPLLTLLAWFQFHFRIEVLDSEIEMGIIKKHYGSFLQSKKKRDYFEKNGNRRDQNEYLPEDGLFIHLQMNVSYFVQRRDATGILGLSSLQKVTAAVRLLSYDVAGDVVDEYLRIGVSTALECLKIFCRVVYDIFFEQDLRQPTREDVARLTAENARRGFPEMLGSIDCMNWAWKNFPIA